VTTDDGSEADDTGSDDAGDGGRDPSARLERLVAGISVAFTLLLLGYVLWQGAATPEGAVPAASVEAVESPPYDDRGPDRLRVTVRIENHGGTGIESAVVGVDCGEAERTIRFTHIPGGGYKTATVTCPLETTPTVTVETWIES
jgi:hypothetical protein